MNSPGTARTRCRTESLNRPVLPWLIALTLLPGSSANPEANAGEIIQVSHRDLQEVIDGAAPNAIIHCDPNREPSLSTPIVIGKPLTLVGLHARLPEKLGKVSLVVVKAKGVAITDFELTGNADSVPQSERVPLMVIHAGDFRVERGIFLNSSKDGVMIDGDGAADGDIVGGMVRDIVGRGVVRDVVSISGSSGKGRKIRHVLVENVRCYDSRLRGAVEVSDGTDTITVRNIYAESAVYALDVQDHKMPDQGNRNVVIENVYAVRCKHALRTANSRQGHANLTIRDITARQCTIPVQISHTRNVHLSNVRVLDHESGQSPVQIEDCSGLFIRDVVLENAAVKGPAVLLENCDEALLDGLNVGGPTDTLTNAICFRLTTNGAFTGLRIRSVSARGTTGAGILLEATGKERGTLTDYLIAGNLATVDDQIRGNRAMVIDNLE